MKKLGRLEEGKNVYHAFHPQYYNLTSLSEEDQKLQDIHLAHCLHLIKDGLMCQADPTVFTMRWGEYDLLPIHNMTNPRECVNWDKFMEGVKDISQDVIQDGVLVHPKFGPLFKNREPVEWERPPMLDHVA
ncbi:hypothetical protein N7510_010528 [Penicillium lagena]|uniref:uncharacterized protein n=1 Tax=Penicillium lagena TaxID=94218 RepID=UPI0025424CE0|nr:uncharacterized protein N7510_010528 [Penicillium lagena]KAJ5600994.1 hypothetical protein N7510_010528 [Penicillium lagena]